MATKLFTDGRQSNRIFHSLRLTTPVQIVTRGTYSRRLGLTWVCMCSASLAQEFILGKFTSRGKH